eukprot:TRINITY_DN4271_c0_g1_i2.p1 TRINITY_DN4271_c0_g1~~TRINITY_DN4271_c0_g1_i2.p1  ORF type:complete len:188 (+),score=30.03 TRINITY_DN4271_c0_g1_i2:36-599(+)
MLHRLCQGSARSISRSKPFNAAPVVILQKNFSDRATQKLRGGFLDEFIRRELTKQWTHDVLNDKEFFDKTKKMLKSENVAAYCGFDPTAESLHLGNYITMLTLFRLNLIGFDALYLVGGATGLIGDPSGKSIERPQLEKSAVLANSQRIQGLMQTVINNLHEFVNACLLYTSPSPRDGLLSRMPSSA